MTARHTASAPARLTERQQEVLALIARGLTNFEIAQELGISLEGAKYHVREVMGKLGVDSREEAAAWYRQQRRPGARIAAFARAWVPAAMWWKVGAGAAVIAAVGAAGLFILLSLNPGGDATPPADGGEAKLCGPGDAVFDVFEADPMDGIVLLVVTGRAEAPCRVNGTVDLVLTSGDPAASPPVLAVSSTRVDMVLDRVRVNMVHANWRGFCGEDVVFATAVVRQEDGAVVRESAGTDVINQPGCDEPLSLEGVWAVPLSFRPDLGPVEELFCFPQAGWEEQCAAVDGVQSALLAGELDAVLDGVTATEFECGVEGEPAWLPLCDGQPAGMTREGLLVDVPGTGLGAMSLEEAGARLSAIRNARVATIGCTGLLCERFAIGIAVRGVEPALYLVFEVGPDGRAEVVLVGFPARDKALALRRGGRATVPLLGEVQFMRVVPPY